MKTEKICFSKKTIIISIIILFLIGVVGVSYLVQSRLTLQSKASEDFTLTACKKEFNTAIIAAVGPKNQSQVDDFRENFVEDGIGSCLSSLEFGGYVVNNTHYNIDINLKCCLRKEGLNGKNRDQEMNNLGFKVENAAITAHTNPTTCINYGVPAPFPKYSCGSAEGAEYVERCTLDDGKEGVREVKVMCENVLNPGNNSCGFMCFNKEANVYEYKCQDTSTCQPKPTQPPAANTFNSTNQTSNQSGAEDNLNCSQNLKQQDGSVLDTGYYKCYVATELLSGTSINRDGDISPAPTKINNRPVVYEANDGTMKLPRYVSTFYGRGKNEPCKKLVAGVSTNGVCASKK